MGDWAAGVNFNVYGAVSFKRVFGVPLTMRSFSCVEHTFEKRTSG